MSSPAPSPADYAHVRAIPTRWRIPPDSSCGYCERRRSASGMRTAFIDRRKRPFGETPRQPDLILADFAEPSAELTEKLQSFVKDQIAPYKYPREIEFVDALPKTATGKLRRSELRRLR